MIALLIEDYEEEVDPIFDNVLAKNFVKTGCLLQVSIGWRDVILSDGFIMFFTTKLANLGFSPGMFAKTPVIEFSVTQFGLEKQLLNLVILMEKRKS
jgi:dynein heavy chain